MTDAAPPWHARAFEMARADYSLKQIAHECGVSKTTVGRLLYPAYRQKQAEGRRKRRAERLATDPDFRAVEIARRIRRRASKKESPRGP